MEPATVISNTDFITDLAQAALSFRDSSKTRPKPDVVVNALLQAEKTAKQQKLTYPFTSLSGNWRLCFATGTRKVRKRSGIILGKGFYMPKFSPAYIGFDILDTSINRGRISNKIQFGGFALELSGLTQYIDKKNLLAFDFHTYEINLFNHKVYSGNVPSSQTNVSNFYDQKIGKLAFFAFFLVTENFIAARGRGGGLALWIKE
ncbi:hypothetical protein NIES2101_05035 [Calothrix sp. HK-06]|nr:hypothetical protein NIES2101_05035 [Calothrix sp. HK-06]